MKRRHVRQHSNAVRQMQQRESVRPGRVAEQVMVRTDPAAILTGMWEDLKVVVQKVAHSLS